MICKVLIFMMSVVCTCLVVVVQQQCAENNDTSGDTNQLISTLVKTQDLQTTLQTVLTSVEDKLVRQELVTSQLHDLVVEQGRQMAALEAMLTGTVNHSKTGDENEPRSVYQCTTSEDRSGYTMLSATGGSWPSAGFCRALTSASTSNISDVTWTTGTVSAELYHHSASWGKGHPGLIYNAADENNYNYVYFRPHSPSSCYQLGHVTNGMIQHTESAACPIGPPARQQWFTVRLDVTSGHDVKVYLNDELVVVTDPPLSRSTRVGVLACNGYSNIIYYRRLQHSWSL